MKLRSIVAIGLSTALITGGTASAAVTPKPMVEIYSAKLYNTFTQKSLKQCGKLSKAKMETCIAKLIASDPNPVILKRTILVDSGAKVIGNTARAMIRDMNAMAAFSDGPVTSKELEDSLKETSLGVIIGTFDKKTNTVKLSIPLEEGGKVVLVQSATISIVKGQPVINGTDALGRKF